MTLLELLLSKEVLEQDPGAAPVADDDGQTTGTWDGDQAGAGAAWDDGDDSDELAQDSTDVAGGAAELDLGWAQAADWDEVASDDSADAAAPAWDAAADDDKNDDDDDNLAANEDPDAAGIDDDDDDEMDA